MLRRLAFALLVLAGCTRHTGGRPTDDLNGLTLELLPKPSLQLLVSGAVGSTPADVAFEISAPMTRVSKGCFSAAPVTGNTVVVNDATGKSETLPEVVLGGLRFGSLRYVELEAALVDGERCVVTVGGDVLSPYALHVSVAARTLTFQPTQSRQSYAELALHPPKERAGDEVNLFEVTRSPSGDWPMLAVRVKQGDAVLTGAFLLASAEERSAVWLDAAHGAGLRTGSELLADLKLPQNIELPEELVDIRRVQFESLELAPGVGVRVGSLKPMEAGEHPAVVGVLGSDVWGRFDAVLDARANVLLLTRPRVLASGAQQKCDRGGRVTEEACYELTVNKTKPLTATATVWKAMPEGGQLHLDFIGPNGQKLSPECRVGITFSPSDRGESTQHQLPWERLKEILPACAKAMAESTSVELALFEDGALAECPGTCAYAKDVRSSNGSCECQPHSNGAANEAERRFLRLYQEMLQRQRGQQPREREPDDPQ